MSAYAGFWLRAAALLIDGVILFVVTSILGVVLGVLLGIAFGLLTMGSGSGEDMIMAFVNLLVFIITIVAEWLYFALMESSSWQATLGKKLVKIKVTNLQGEQISFGQATGRYFAKYLSFLILCVGYLMVAFTEKKQGLHDILASTLVIKEKQLSDLAR